MCICVCMCIVWCMFVVYGLICGACFVCVCAVVYVWGICLGGV